MNQDASFKVAQHATVLSGRWHITETYRMYMLKFMNFL